MLEATSTLKLDVERGPDWLFVRLHAPDVKIEGEPIAEQLWSLMEQHFINRLVVELDDVPALRSYLIGQLVLLYKRIHERGGMLRICGLTDVQRQVLRTMRLDERFPCYENRAAALMGSGQFARPK